MSIVASVNRLECRLSASGCCKTSSALSPGAPIAHVACHLETASGPAGHHAPRRGGERRLHRRSSLLASYAPGWIAVRTALPGSGCGIKGNVSIETAERSYHVPGKLCYQETRSRRNMANAGSVARPRRGRRGGDARDGSLVRHTADNLNCCCEPQL